MTKRKSPDLADFARLAAVESAHASAVGEFQKVVDEGDELLGTGVLHNVHPLQPLVNGQEPFELISETTVFEL